MERDAKAGRTGNQRSDGKGNNYGMRRDRSFRTAEHGPMVAHDGISDGH